MEKLRILRWTGEKPPDEAAVRAAMQAAGLSFYAWSNAPGEVYAAHTHPYDKVLMVARGSITFVLPDRREEMTLHPGDRLDLPAGVRHAARVGPQGVTCLEAHR